MGRKLSRREKCPRGNIQGGNVLHSSAPQVTLALAPVFKLQNKANCTGTDTVTGTCSRSFSDGQKTHESETTM